MAIESAPGSRNAASFPVIRGLASDIGCFPEIFFPESIAVETGPVEGRVRYVFGRFSTARSFWRTTHFNASADSVYGHSWFTIKSYRSVSLDMLESIGCSLSEPEFRRARHVISEIARTEHAFRAIQSDCWAEVGSLIYASHQSLRDDFQVSSMELDFIVQMFEEIGPGGDAIGAKMTGGGFGGCVIAVVKTDQLDAVTERLQSRYFDRFGCKARTYLLYPSGASRGLRDE